MMHLLAAFATWALIGSAAAEIHILDFSSTPAAGQLSLSDIPDRPRSHVVDESSRLSSETREALEAALSASRAAPTYLVILDRDLPAEPHVFGNELLRRWVTGGGRLGALVLAVPTPLPSTHVMIAGRTLDKTDVDQLRQLADAALKLAGEDLSQAEGAAQSALSLLPALETFAELYNESVASPAPKPETATGGAPGSPTPAEAYVPKEISRWDTLSARLDWDKVRMISGIVGGLLLLILVTLFVPRMLRQRRFVFPPCQARQRFNAPFAGGSNAQIKFRHMRRS